MSKRAAPGQVEEPLAQLGRAGPAVGAADVDVALLRRRQRRCRRRGSAVGITNSRSVPSRRSTTGPTISGMTSPALRSTTVSPISTPLRFTSRRVVQGRHLDRRAADEDRLHHAERRDPAGAADVDPDVEQLGGHLLGRVLVGDRPARRPAGRPEPALQRHLVDLDHDAVDLVLDVVPVLAVVVDVAPHPVQVVDDPAPVADRQAPAAQRLVGLGLPCRRRSPRRAPMPCTTIRSGRRRGDPRDPSAAATRRRRCAGWRTAPCRPRPAGR